MLAVVALRQGAVDLQQLEPDDAQAAALQPVQDLAGEAALHGVRFDQDQGAFHE